MSNNNMCIDNSPQFTNIYSKIISNNNINIKDSNNIMNSNSNNNNDSNITGNDSINCSTSIDIDALSDLSRQMSEDTVSEFEEKKDSNISVNSNNNNNNNNSDDGNAIYFEDNTFSQNLLPSVRLLCVAYDSIKSLVPINSLKWKNIAKINADIEDASFILCDNDTKLIRCGGLNNKIESYINDVQLCDLQYNKWYSLPKMYKTRHGHKIISNNNMFTIIGGFDENGNTIDKCEVIKCDNISKYIKNKNNNICWNNNIIKKMPYGISDFGICNNNITNNIYICGGLNGSFKSVNTCIMYDINKNKWLNLPKMNMPRHFCNCLLWNNNTLMCISGFNVNNHKTIECLDLRSNNNRWSIMSKKINNKVIHNTFNYNHTNGCNIVKLYSGIKNITGALNTNHFASPMNSNNINSNNIDNTEHTIIVCGNKDGLFIETNYIEAYDMRNEKWNVIAKFKEPTTNNNNNIISVQKQKEYHKYSYGLRYLTFL